MFAPSGRARLAFDLTAPAPGTDVLLIHAGVTDRRSWRPVVAELSERHRCLAYDARGYGETTYAPEPGFSEAGDACAVLDAAGVESACVVAGSHGGQTAIDLALAHPDRVRGLALIAPGARGAPAPASDPATDRLAARIDAAEAAGDWAEVNRLEAWMWLDGPGSPEGRAGGAVRELFLEMNGHALRAPDTGTPDEPAAAWPRLAQIIQPTRVIVGSLDTAHMQGIAHGVADRVPDARLLEVAGVAHLPQMEGDRSTLEAIAALADAVG